MVVLAGTDCPFGTANVILTLLQGLTTMSCTCAFALLPANTVDSSSTHFRRRADAVGKEGMLRFMSELPFLKCLGHPGTTSLALLEPVHENPLAQPRRCDDAAAPRQSREQHVLRMPFHREKPARVHAFEL